MVSFFRILSSARHVVFCPMNFVADTYIGCPHACWYCYAPKFTYMGDYFTSMEKFRFFKRRLRDEDFDKIQRAIGRGEVRGTCDKKVEYFVSRAIKHKYPLRIGSVSEPFGLPLEKQYGDTYRILEILIDNDYPFIVCTKSPLVADKKYINLFKSAKKVGVQISLISINEKLLSYLESREGGRTPSAESRLKALKRLSEEGIFTTCRIQPVIPRVTEYDMKDLIFALAEVGVNHVIIEFLWFPQGHEKKMSMQLKYILDKYYRDGGYIGEDLLKFENDLLRFYKSFDDCVVGYGRVFFSKYEINRLMKKFVRIIEEANKEYGSRMTFGSGNEETSYLNHTDNCCGVDRIEGFLNYNICTGQMALKLARLRGKVSVKDIKPCYSILPEKFEEAWSMYRKGKYFLEERMFKLRGLIEASGEVSYVYDESAVLGDE